MTVGVWIDKEGMENQATGSLRQDFHGNGKRDALLGIDHERIDNKTIAAFLEGGEGTADIFQPFGQKQVPLPFVDIAP
jgi:hypothetical protein